MQAPIVFPVTLNQLVVPQATRPIVGHVVVGSRDVSLNGPEASKAHRVLQASAKRR